MFDLNFMSLPNFMKREDTLLKTNLKNTVKDGHIQKFKS